MESTCKNNKISIYLLKPGYDETNALKPEFLSYNKEMLYSSDSCKTFAASKLLRSPSWIESFYSSNGNEVVSSFPKVISIYSFIIDGEKVSFAIPFGGGKSMLENDAYVDDFGLRVLLNSVESNQFRQLQINDCGKNFRSTSSQLPKLGSIDDFVFDCNTEILRKAVAKCDDEIFANNNISGGDGITLNGPYKCDTVQPLLEECYKRYKSTNYRKSFGWLDNIKEVKDNVLKEKLENKLVEVINSQNFDSVWMAVPDVIQWENVAGFKFRKKDNLEDDISISSFLDTFDNRHIDNFQQITNKRVIAVGPNGEENIIWQAHKCVMCEISLGDGIYCFNYGKWYNVNQDYSKEINEYYDKILISNTDFAICNERFENVYNEKLANFISGSVLMDRKIIQATDVGKSPIELCDVLTKDGELIHIKRCESSSYLSHLFNQARVSCDLLFDTKFRHKANDVIGYEYFNESFKPNNYAITLGIITNKQGQVPKIPFFSKVAIKYLDQELKKMGYKLYLKNIYYTNN